MHQARGCSIPVKSLNYLIAAEAPSSQLLILPFKLNNGLFKKSPLLHVLGPFKCYFPAIKVLKMDIFQHDYKKNI